MDKDFIQIDLNYHHILRFVAKGVIGKHHLKALLHPFGDTYVSQVTQFLQN